MAFDLIPGNFFRFPMVDDEDWQVSNQTPSGISISEDEKYVFITTALPGVTEKNIDITFDKGMLWVKGEVEEEETDKKRKYFRKSTSSFSYRVAVPGEVDLSVEPEATYKNGVMTVKFTKSPIAQPKKISVKNSK
jgi:HSP20 family protein